MKGYHNDYYTRRSKLSRKAQQKQARPKIDWWVITILIGSLVLLLWYLNDECPVAVPILFLCFLFVFVVFTVHWAVNTYAVPAYNEDLSGEDHSFSFIVRHVFVPLAVGFMAMMVAESINPNKIPVTIAVGDSHSGYQSNYQIEVQDQHIDPAIRTLGDFNEIFDMRVIGVTPYEQLLADMTRGKVDMAGIPPYEHVFYEWLFDQNLTMRDERIEAFRINYERAEVLAFKSTTETGNYFLPGLLFHRRDNPELQYIEDNGKVIDTIIEKAKKGKVIFYTSGQLMSSSGKNVPLSWMLHLGIGRSWIDSTFSVSSSEVLTVLSEWYKRDNLCADSMHNLCSPTKQNRYSVAFFSSNQWSILKRYKPEVAAEFRWVPIEGLPIPYEPVLYRPDKWREKFDSGGKRWWDMVTLRNIKFWKSRGVVIEESLESFMTVPDTTLDLRHLWRNNNAEFMDMLRSGRVVSKDTLKREIKVCFPAPFDIDNRQLQYEFEKDSIYVLELYTLKKRQNYNRFDNLGGFDYPLERSGRKSFNLKFVDDISSHLDKGSSEYLFSEVNQGDIDSIWQHKDNWVFPSQACFRLRKKENTDF